MDKYDKYADLFDPMQNDRQVRRKRKRDPNHEPKMTEQEIIEEIADPVGLEGDFEMTYNPSKHEGGWLLDSIGAFFNLSYITDVLAQVKGGKEASVYRCAAHESTGHEFLAAKVYRPRMFRQLRNDAMYRQGRTLLNADGKEVEPHDQRTMRAVDKKSSYGALVAHTSWLMHEFKTMQQLHKLGITVPEVIVSSENAILMTYVGDGQIAAPTLNSVTLQPEQAAPLFDGLLHDIDLMLREGIVHGDLSAYNILYWDGALTLIDFPQVVDVHSNENAYAIFERDITRVCEYFARQGVRHDPQSLARSMWDQYLRQDPKEAQADLSRLLYETTDEDEDE